jgi:hypothetical protein
MGFVRSPLCGEGKGRVGRLGTIFGHFVTGVRPSTWRYTAVLRIPSQTSKWCFGLHSPFINRPLGERVFFILTLICFTHVNGLIFECHKKANITTELTALLLDSREFRGSNLTPETGYPNSDFSLFFSLSLK